MGVIYFRNAQKEYIDFEPVYIDIIRGDNNTIIKTVSYLEGNGQSIVIDEVLYSVGEFGQPDYFVVKSKSNHTISGSGTFQIEISTIPNSTQQHQTKEIDFNGSKLLLVLNYNSRPVVQNIDLTIPNQSVVVLNFDVFNSKYTDFDGDQMASISVSGDVTGYKLDGLPYVSEQDVSILQLMDGLFTYESLPQNIAYIKVNNWIAKDSLGNTSNLVSDNLIINIQEAENLEVCKLPIIENITYSSMRDFHLIWNYNGGVYESATITIRYTLDGTNYEDFTTIFNYPTTEANINIPTLPDWEELTFKIYLQTETCKQESSRFGLEFHAL